MNLKERARTLKINIPAVFIALKRKETPYLAKLFASLTLIYAFSPIDLIPDFIPLLGYLDDLIILPILITTTIKLIPKELFKLYRIEAENLIDQSISKKWYFAIPFILFWVTMLYLIIIKIRTLFH